MKRFKARKMKQVALALLLMVLLVPLAAYGQGETVGVKGYIWEGMTEEEIIAAPVHFTVSNVKEELEGVIKNVDAQLLVEAPAVITSESMAAIFEACPIIEKDGFLEPQYDAALPVAGPVSIYLPDPSGEADESGYVGYVDINVDASEIDNYEGIEMITYLEGSSITITEPGDYYVNLRVEAMAGSASAFVRVVDKEVETEESEKPEEVEKPVEKLAAESTKSKVLVNGQDIAFDAYKIKDNNYFKLRDLAKVVSGTEKQFEVDWNEDTQSIELISNQAYTEVGGELDLGDGLNKTAESSTSLIYKDGELIELLAYKIGGNNYFKLRDIGKVFDFDIRWDNETQTISIDTSQGYDPATE